MKDTVKQPILNRAIGVLALMSINTTSQHHPLGRGPLRMITSRGRSILVEGGTDVMSSNTKVLEGHDTRSTINSIITFFIM